MPPDILNSETEPRADSKIIKAIKASPASPRKAGTLIENNPKKSFHIAGIGGSAGSLEAFEEFFRNMPADTGMAFVLVSHLDPTHKALLAELLQRVTDMLVVEVTDGMKVLPNTVYVIPPNKDMSIMHGTLQLLEPSMPRGFRMPIDFFFRHLADDQREAGIGIILSGMGTDGTLGIKAIKERSGLVMVQDMSSAKYDGMPQSAINTGLADFVAPVSELPAKLQSYLNHSSELTRVLPVSEKKTTGALNKIFAILRAQTGNDFSLYKKSTVNRRIERRMNIHQISNINQYVHYLSENSTEIDLLFKELLIGVTCFFREPDSFAVLKDKILSPLLKSRKGTGTIRVWVVGCSTGEEAYSIAIVFRECLDELGTKSNFTIKIYATDLDKVAIDVARKGTYPANIAQDVSEERLQRFFIKEDGGYRIRSEIREMIVFAQQNVLTDPPFTRLDLLSCRNLLIYLNPETQKKLMQLFHFSLNPGGLLLLGSSESIGGFKDLFSPVDNKWKLFERRENLAAHRFLVEFPTMPLSYEDKMHEAKRGHIGSSAGIIEIAQTHILQTIAPPVVLINDQGDILYLTRQTGKYLEPPVGKANMNIYAMAREGLRADLGAAIRRARAENRKVTIEGLRVGTNGSEQTLNLTVTPFDKPDAMRGLMMVLFEDVAASTEVARPARGKSRLTSRQKVIQEELEKELQYTKEHLQTVMEEMETSQEELKSANEELQSTNEELQSTNEEMVTSKEELQSLNEELTTLNAELQSKNEELSETGDDLKNLLDSTEVATLFLDNNLKIRRFTPYATKIISLIPGDIGRPIADIVLNLQYDDLAKDANEVLKTRVSKETQVQTKGESWYLMKIVPYRTTENIIDGVVITFSDITDLKRIGESMADRAEYAEGIISTVREPLLVLNGEMKIVSANPSFYRTFHVTSEETEGKTLYNLGNGQWNIPALRKLLEELLPKNTQIEGFLMEHEFPTIGKRRMLLNARRIAQEGSRKELILLAIEDITNRKEQP
jgi:two-component system, chemotaxis family, CheB/CheR fusion protein